MTSAQTGEGVEELRQAIAGKLTAFTGNSGVGKSSILNCLAPELQLQTGEVSEKLGRGRHTTRCVSLYDLGNDTFIADTPGFSSFDTDQMEIILKENLQYAFQDFAPYIGRCQFADCAHLREPGCAVTQALAAGELEETRYQSYVRLYEKAKEIKTEADKAKLIKESQEMEEKWTTRIEESAKALDGKPVAVADGEIKVTEPLSLTFDGFFSKSDITPVFVVSGAAQAAVDITTESEFPRSSYQVYIVGYGPDGAEVFDNRIGTIDAQEIDGKAVISAGTPVKFERLQFSGKDAPDYPIAETLKLVVEE